MIQSLDHLFLSSIDHSPLTQAESNVDKPLGTLVIEGNQQIMRFRTEATSGEEGASCVEIVRRAATGDEDALVALLQISEPFVRRKCPPQLLTEIDDVIQDVSLRLVRKFRNAQSPYQTTTFAAYITYLNLTIRSVTINMIRRDKNPDSLEQFYSERGFEPSVKAATSEVERRMLLQELLLLLPDPLEREALHRRYTLQETPGEIAETLQAKAPGITKVQVYRLVERGLRRLGNHPEVVEVREALVN